MNQIVILAAGKGTRMGSELPKALVPVNGRPMILYVLDTVIASGLDTQPIVIVSPENKAIIQDALKDYSVQYAIQEQQLGTGHAIISARPFIKEGVEKVFVLYCDHPFLKPASLIKAAQTPTESVLVMTTTLPDFEGWHHNFYHWGRFVRNEAGNIERIVEFKDANLEEQAITEVNPGFMVFNNNWLWPNVSKLSNDNSQKEYYLTALPGLAAAQNFIIPSIEIEALEAMGINSQAELSLAEEALAEIL